jgi:hypothetical protein
LEGKLHKATAVQQLGALRHEDFDVFVNLCDGAWDEDRAGIEVVQTLERFNLAFTGAGSAFYEASALLFSSERPRAAAPDMAAPPAMTPRKFLPS